MEEKPLLEFLKTGDLTKLKLSPGKNHAAPEKTEPEPPIQTSPYLLYLGTIEPRKNLDILIDAYFDLTSKEEITRVNLVLAGEVGWKAKKILQKINETNAKFAEGNVGANPPQIILTGYLTEEEKKNYYKHAAIFIYPSLYEGFGMPPLEAMAHGTAVICSTGGSLKEIFGDHALTFDPKDKTQLKKHIKTLLENPRLKKDQIRKARKFSETFDWQQSAKKFLQAIKNC